MMEISKVDLYMGVGVHDYQFLSKKFDHVTPLLVSLLALKFSSTPIKL